jgi:hypothetical protein
MLCKLSGERPTVPDGNVSWRSAAAEACADVRRDAGAVARTGVGKSGFEAKACAEGDRCCLLAGTLHTLGGWAFANNLSYRHLATEFRQSHCWQLVNASFRSYRSLKNDQATAKM